MPFPIIRNHVDTTFNTFHVQVFNLKEDLVTTGWRVLGSGDGDSKFENTGQSGGAGTGSGGGFDVWDTAADAAQGGTVVSGDGSWLRLAPPLDAPAQYEMLLMIEQTANPGNNEGQWRIEMSRNGVGFTVGGTAGLAPTATDQVGIGMQRPDTRTNGDLSAYLAPSGASKVFYWIGDSEEDYDILFLVFRSDDQVYSAWGNMYVGVPNQALATAPDPFVYIRILQDSSGASTDIWGIRAREIVSPSEADSEIPEESNTRTTADRGVFMSYKNGEGHPLSGTYRGALYVPCQFAAGDFQPFTETGRDPSTGANMSVSPLMWGKQRGKVHFLKGFTKNETLHIAAHADSTGDYKVVQGPSPDNKVRFVFDGLSVPWDASKQLEVF